MKTASDMVDNILFLDGSFKNFNMGLGIIWCDNAGKIKGSRANFGLISDALGAEVSALLLAVNWVQEMNLSKALFVSDCLQLVDFVYGDCVDPPTTKEEAILQAKTCLSITLEKPLNNPRLSAGKLKKQKQPKLRVEIPVSNDSNESLTQLAFDIFQDLPVRRKDSPINLLLLWPNATLTDLAATTFFKPQSSNQTIQNLDISSVCNTDSYNKVLNSADVTVFLVPDKTELELIKRISDGVYPKPVVVFNPKWGFEEESGFGELSGFVGSFEVVYSFMGVEVRGLLSKKKAVVFRNAKDGVLSGDKWLVLVEEEEEEGKLKVVTKYKKRPTIGEIENVLYNLMAVNSPVTKSVKFFRDLVSNARGKK
ncbi:uncharacterized protein LOC113352073 [Papaver somniferum]|uniref:uncharacterized protein LOC113352073 n=1 Tax=Papaver somniferum TaxID=3469 RepID=UPI000E700A5A|nr:uncharacterized protein LOC113352073 [Papaver somniferum]